ncbi:MAG: YdeI/OmpD-associated family protein [Chitinophagaceae bacterium]|nr:YdeI/OmpD-associated family protein [Chitinophagaceae bacterium]MCB9046396.1 YdeI/OmpD-associated family protein [Chitinophagales bacterium]
MQPKFFKKPSDLRKWLVKNHETATELHVGYYKKGTGKPSITWPESVDEALCFGWIDGMRRGIDEESYMIRFTPRKPKSIWSVVNVKKVEELKAKGLMYPMGLAAYERKEDHRSVIYSFEQKKEDLVLPPEYLKEFKKNRKAWAFFERSAPHYRLPATWWVISAKQETTRLKRLKELITDSEAHLKVKHLRR